jgi:hypothetical protein
MIWWPIDMLEHPLLIVQPERDSGHRWGYEEPNLLALATLARRLFAACSERWQAVAICSSRELLDISADRLRRVTAAVVDPMGCAATSGDEQRFFSKLTGARKRVLVLSEATETARYGRQFRLPADFDAVFDIGFVPQGDRYPRFEVPYHFVFNGPTEEEEQIISEQSPSQERCIPWAVVGSRTPRHLNLVAELTDHNLYAGGFCFLEHHTQQGRRGTGLLSPSGLTAVLSKTNYYVWSSDDPLEYYESSYFIQALLAGAVPCKIVAGHTSREESDIPGIFPSVRSFFDRVQEEGYWSMYCSSRDFYTSRGLMAGHLEEALRLV